MFSCIGMRTSSAVWLAIKSMFASQSRTRIANLWVKLATTKKEGNTTTQYFAAVKTITDELATVGRQMEEDEIIEYLLAGLDDTYNPLFAAIGINPDLKIFVSELYSQVTLYDNRMTLLLGTDDIGSSSVNSASHGRGGPRRRGRGGQRGRGGVRGRGNSQGRPQQQGGHGGGQGCRGSGNRGGNNSRDKDRNTLCQICGKLGHPAWRCWYRYEEDDE
jgi:hypothetical protein